MRFPLRPVKRDEPTEACRGFVVVSCNHILAMLDLAQPADQIVTFRMQANLWLEYYWPVLDNSVPPVDIAVGRSGDLSAFVANEVRGLGEIRGVATAIDGERVFKCGAATSITTEVAALRTSPPVPMLSTVRL